MAIHTRKKSTYALSIDQHDLRRHDVLNDSLLHTVQCICMLLRHLGVMRCVGRRLRIFSCSFCKDVEGVDYILTTGLRAAGGKVPLMISLRISHCVTATSQTILELKRVLLLTESPSPANLIRLGLSIETFLETYHGPR